jgi:hypothetical protein
VRGQNPRRLKTQEGIEWLAGLIHLLVATDRRPDERLEVEGLAVGALEDSRAQAASANGMKVRASDELGWLVVGESP